MKAAVAWLGIALVMLGGSTAALAGDLKDKVRVEIEDATLQPGMEPGTYACALGHLHIQGTVQNRAGVTLGQVKVAGKAFDSDGKLLGTATASTRPAVLHPRETAQFNLEFLTVTGPLIRRVARHEVSVVEARPTQ